VARGQWPAEPVYLPPLRVITRQSTDTMAIEDPLVLAALKYIRQHAANRVSVGKVVHEIGCGRRELERHFRLVLGRSVLDDIRLVRIERAKEMLLGTDLAMPAVARQAGFCNPQRFAVVFRQLTGMAPTAFRRQSRTRTQS
jgi:LacI family transcriptional regulator